MLVEKICIFLQDLKTEVKITCLHFPPPFSVKKGKMMDEGKIMNGGMVKIGLKEMGLGSKWATRGQIRG